MPEIVILGAGLMGSAMAFPATAAGNSVTLVGTHLDQEIIESIVSTGRHPRLDMLMPAGVEALQHDQFATSLTEKTALVVLGVSSPGVDWAIEKLVRDLKRTIPVLMITKGLAVRGQSIEVLPIKVARELERRLGFRVPVMAVGGPCIAGELAARRPSCVVFTGAADTPLEETVRLLATDFYFPKPARDLIGVEVAVALKNLFVIGVTAVTGRLEREGKGPNGAVMYNLAASLFAQASREIANLVMALGGDPMTAFGLPGVGDLYVTSQGGRTALLGRYLGLGLTYRQAREQHLAGVTIEAAELAAAVGPTLRAMMSDGRLDPTRLPLTRAILDALLSEKVLVLDWDAFHRA
jgi:glycerol-3-phosphate dehydrogenase (NAD(P)+)